MANKDFFLSPDDAQTLGDINYMRKTVQVRHTFPKNLKNPNGFEIVKEVSASKDRFVNQSNENTREKSFAQSTSQSTNDSNTNFVSQTNQSSSNSSGSSIDMFRNMARSIRKK